MTPEGWQKIKELLADALELNYSDRLTFLKRACANDETLFNEAAAILASQEAPPVLLQILSTQPKRLGPLAIGQSVLNGRFQLLDFLGSGSVGAVYHALDQDRHEHVALKVLHCPEPELVARLKNEFRSLQSTSHQNLVRIDELFEADGRCFFSMELIEGANLLEYVRASAPVGMAYNPDRLLPSFSQLCEGISALHHVGQLHRDIKPANVLVTQQGRVVLLDFSVIRELKAGTAKQTFVGTLPYSAPEQVLQLTTVSKAADWFAVGVILYEALIGVPPFEGEYWRWIKDDAPYPIVHPSVRKPAIPHDFADLCMALLSRAPESRPDADEIFRRLRMMGGEASASSPVPERSPELFVGRETQLTQLHELFGRTLAGNAVIASLFGRSGMGKTTLLQRFLKELSQEYPEAVILTGRCHQSEMVPFKALDEIVGRLSRLLKELSLSEVEAVLSRDIHLAARLFPSLIQVPAIALSEHRRIDIADSQEFRKRAFSSLLELLGRLCSRSPVVIAIDDLQWGDLDSAVFFKEFVSSVSPANLLLIASYRSEDLESSEFLKETRKHLSAANPQVIIERIEIGELSVSESAKLAQYLLADAIAAPEHQAITIAQESLGSPFIIDQFARYVFDRQTQCMPLEAVQDQMFDLREVIEARIGKLPDSAGILLKIVSVAGQPISERLARAAAGLSSEYFLALGRLCSENLVRIRETSGGRQVEIYHDKIREILNASLAAEARKELHREIAAALQEIEPEDPAVLAMHFLEAQMYDEAARFTTEAADKAYAALAFERSARLYREVIDLKSQDRALVLQLRRKLGDTLAASGRGVEAAEAYMASAEMEADPSRRIECFRLAADQYLRSGHPLQGVDILRKLATSVGIQITENRYRVLMLILVRRALIRLRGLRYHERQECEIASERLLRLDVYWSLVAGFSMIDPLLGVMFHSKHLLLALRIGEPYRVGLSVALEAGFSSFQGESTYARAQELLRKCATLGLQLNRPHLLGLTSVVGASCASLTGRWRDAKQLAMKAMEMLQSQCTGVAWELATARTYYFVALVQLGEWKELSEILPSALQDAQERNDLYALTHLILTAGTHLVSIAADRPEEAYQNISVAIANWSKSTQRTFDHFISIVELVDVLLYKTSGEQAWVLINQNWGWMRRLLSIIRIEWLVVAAYQTRGRAALAAACATSGGKQRTLLTKARESAARIERHKIGAPFSALIHASIEEMLGRHSDSLRFLATAEAGFEFFEMRMYAAATRYRRGALTGGTDGRVLQASALAFMESQSIVKPQHVVDMFAPGKWS